MSKPKDKLERQVIRDDRFVPEGWYGGYAPNQLDNFKGDVDELIVKLRTLRDAHPEFDRIEIDIFNYIDDGFAVSFAGIRMETDVEFEMRKVKLEQERKRVATKAAKSRASLEVKERKKLEQLKAKYEKENKTSKKKSKKKSKT